MNLAEIDIEKIEEFMGGAVERCGGTIVSVRRHKTRVVFNVVNCDPVCVADAVKQALGKYAYPFEAWRGRNGQICVG